MPKPQLTLKRGLSDDDHPSETIKRRRDVAAVDVVSSLPARDPDILVEPIITDEEQQDAGVETDSLVSFYRAVVSYFQYGFSSEEIVDLILVIHILPSTFRYLTAIENACPNIHIAALVAKSSAPHEEALHDIEGKYGDRLIRGMKREIHDSVVVAEQVISTYCTTPRSIVIFDMGGYFSKLFGSIPETHPLNSRTLVIVEDTRNGEDAYWPRMGEISVPVCCVEDLPGIPGVKAAENSEVAHSIVDATWPILQSTYQMEFSDIHLRIGVIGFGKIGEHIALYLKNRYGCHVTVYDNNPSRMLSASRTFFIVGSVIEILKQSDLVFSATGKGSFGARELSQLSKERKKRLFVASCTSAETEFQGGFGTPIKHDKASTVYSFGFELHMLKGGNAMNFPEADIEPNIHAVMAAHLVFLYRAVYLRSSLERNQINYLSSGDTEILARLFLRELKGVSLGGQAHFVKSTDNFIGREKELQLLSRGLIPTYAGAFSSNSMVLLNAKEGVGATELVRQFAHQHCDHYNLIYYGSLTTFSSADEFYIDFARAVRLNIEGVKDIQKTVFQFLSLQSHFLLIVDNAHLQKMLIEILYKQLIEVVGGFGRKHIICVGIYHEQFLEKMQGRHVLYKTIYTNLHMSSMELTSLCPDDLRTFFSQHPSVCFDVEALPGELRPRLTPLILFLLSKQFKFFEIYDSLRQVSIAREILEQMDNSIGQIIKNYFLGETRDMQLSIAKLTLVDPDDIPNSFFQDDEVCFLKAMGLIDGPAQFDRSLLGEECSWRTPVSIQSAIKKILLDKYYYDLSQQAFVSMIVMFSEVFSYNFYMASISSYEEIEYYKNLLHHLFFILKVAKRLSGTQNHFSIEDYTFTVLLLPEYVVLLNQNESVVDLFARIGDFYLHEARDYRLARQFYTYVLELIAANPELSPNMRLLKGRGFLGYAINNFMLKRDTQSKSMSSSEKFVAISKHIFDQDDDNVLARIYSIEADLQLSFIFDWMKQHNSSCIGDPFAILEKARENLSVLEDLLEDDEKVVCDRILAVLYHQLGSLYKRSANYDQAKEMFLLALGLRESLAPSHPDLARTKFRLAEVYYHSRKFFDALRYAKEALAAQLTHLHEEHSNVIEAQRLIAQIEGGIQSSDDFDFREFVEVAKSARPGLFFSSPLRPARLEPVQVTQSLPLESPLPSGLFRSPVLFSRVPSQQAIPNSFSLPPMLEK